MFPRKCHLPYHQNMRSLNFKLVAFFFILLTIGAVNSLSSQSRKELENKKKLLSKDIEYKNKLLEETKKNQKSSLNELVILKKKINEREQLINTINNEIRFLDGEIKTTNSLIGSLEKELQKQKNEFAKLIYAAFKTRNNYKKIIYIFASADLNQAYRRMKYMQQYADYRRHQADVILKTHKELADKTMALEKQKLDKKQLLNEEQNERSSLAVEKGLQQNVFNSLKQKETQLKQELKQKQKEAEQLTKAIKKIIQEELKRQAEEKKRSGFALTPEARALSENFANNQGKLPWPIENGVITEKYGEHAHPVLREVKVNNNGVNFNTKSGTPARAVFDGIVSRVIVIPGAGKAVILRHGEYLTVYMNLADVFVKMNDTVETKQSIGNIITDAGKTDLHFEVWKGQVTLNPSQWLYNIK